MAYQVFISYKHTSVDGSGKTRDYFLAKDLHETLLQEGIAAFFSDKDLSDAAFASEINRALDEARILVLVGTKPEHITSEWVSKEWENFYTALRIGRKEGGQLYTYLDGMSSRQLPMMLLSQQSYPPKEKDALVARIKQNLGMADKPTPAPDPRPAVAKTTKPKKRLLPAVVVVIVVCLLAGLTGYAWHRQKEPASAQTPALNDITSIRQISAGDRLTFGTYEQDNDTSNGAEPIEWRVLAVENGKALLITEKLLDYQPYHQVNTQVTWETCTLRTWMNETFYAKAFASEEQAKIAKTRNVNYNNPDYQSNGGSATRDDVFALSISEADAYFSSDEAKITYATDYAAQKSSGEHAGQWWLRSPGFDGSLAAYVKGEGNLDAYGFYVFSDQIAVRPALWVQF